MSAKKIDLTYANGFVRGRVATADDSSGEERTVAGVDFRLRVSEIIGYHAGIPGVVVIWVKDSKDQVELVGSMAAMDKIMARVDLKDVSGPREVDLGAAT